MPYRTVEKTYSKTCHPYAERFVDYHGTRVITPIAFHYVGSPDANEGSDD